MLEQTRKIPESPCVEKVIRVNVNGALCDLPCATSVAQLLDMLHVRREGSAVELNRDIIPRAKHAEVVLKEGDAIEIVTFVGGG